MARKLTDGAVAHLRELWREGVSAGDLSAMFGVSRQHVSRLVREEQRPVIAGLDADRLRSSVSEAVDAFLADAELGPGDAAMAAVARTLAAKIDALATAETVAAAQAVPRLSAELAVVLDRLRTPIRRPDELDELVQRRAARRLAAAAGTNDRPAVRPPH